MAIDANNKLLPFTFAVVNKKSGPSWGVVFKVPQDFDGACDT